MSHPNSNLYLLPSILEEDQKALTKAEEYYGNSWKKRGGVGAFMMLARKWDRIENQVTFQAQEGGDSYDIFRTLKDQADDETEEGIIDDIRDLRRYLLLVESELLLWKNHT
jgi:hypothetical protein|tara:strand:- start:9893 stop:10225 length:333 start_codon:yes stop_codon:yes gene_type:complete